MEPAPNYEEYSDEKLIIEAANKLSLNDMWVTLAKLRMTRPEAREPMRAKLIRSLLLMHEYQVS